MEGAKEDAITKRKVKFVKLSSVATSGARNPINLTDKRYGLPPQTTD